MIGIARENSRTRSDLFRIAAAEMRLEPAIVEKDFWVCYLLDHLFHRNEFKESIVFKGGTSLSKAYGSLSGSLKTSPSSLTGDSSVMGSTSRGRSAPTPNRTNSSSKPSSARIPT